VTNGSYLAVDPGISTGFALLDHNGVLSLCGRGQVFPKCTRAVIELPQIYRKSPVPPADLITLGVRVGQYKERLEVAGAEVQLVQPATWKHQVAKNIHHPRILASLRPEELPAMRAGLKGLTEKQAEDVWDAIGLVKWAWTMGRFASTDTSKTPGKTASRSR
jgi:hypothetical protein